VTFAGMGPQKDVTVKGKELNADDVLGRLAKAGFQGVIAEKEKKKK
jgi:hypothetical protein